MHCVCQKTQNPSCDMALKNLWKAWLIFCRYFSWRTTEKRFYMQRKHWEVKLWSERVKCKVRVCQKLVSETDMNENYLKIYGFCAQYFHLHCLCCCFWVHLCESGSVQSRNVASLVSTWTEDTKKERYQIKIPIYKHIWQET